MGEGNKLSAGHARRYGGSARPYCDTVIDFVTSNQTTVVPFGKHKGRSIEELLADDPAYLQWLASQDWFRDKYVSLHQTIINCGAEPEETPEHNAMQVRFLDDAFCLRFMCCYRPELMLETRHALAAQWAYRDNFAAAESAFLILREERPTRALQALALQAQMEARRAQVQRARELAEVADRWHKLSKADLEAKILPYLDKVAPIEFRIERRFEEQDVDVILSADAHCPPHDLRVRVSPGYPYSDELQIELKPTVGDDYPAVLRQMRRNGSRVLLAGKYAGTGASRDQLVETFATASICVIFLHEVEEG
jgi:uncharacterized protein (DUF3820 family)